MRYFIFILALSSGLPAEEITLRIIGLSEPERVADLRTQVATLPGLEVAKVIFETGEVTFGYDPKIFLPGYNPKKPPVEATIIRRIGEQLQNSSKNLFLLNPEPRISDEKLQTVHFQAGLLDCKACRYAVYIIAAKTKGVEHAQITPQGLLTVHLDPSQTNQEALASALRKARVDLEPR